MVHEHHHQAMRLWISSAAAGWQCAAEKPPNKKSLCAPARCLRPWHLFNDLRFPINDKAWRTALLFNYWEEPNKGRNLRERWLSADAVRAYRWLRKVQRQFHTHTRAAFCFCILDSCTEKKKNNRFAPAWNAWLIIIFQLWYPFS